MLGRTQSRNKLETPKVFYLLESEAISFTPACINSWTVIKTIVIVKKSLQRKFRREANFGKETVAYHAAKEWINIGTKNR